MPTSRSAAPPAGPPHGGPSRVTVQWIAGGVVSFVAASSTSSVLRQFEAARAHGKTWVVEDLAHRVHIVMPDAVGYISIEPARPGERRPRAHSNNR